MSVDLLYVTFNRYAYVAETFPALIKNTDWQLVERLFILDDASTDDSIGYLHEAKNQVAAEVVLRTGPLGGPVAAMNWYLDHATPGVERFAKVDNDFVVCPGWLSELNRVMDENPEIDILGIEPMRGNPTMPPLADRGAVECSHVGGKALIKHAAFGRERMTANGYFGFTGWQTSHERVLKSWADPDLPVFGCDQLPFEPWVSIARSYVERGWHRYWPPYAPESHGYWDWWVAEDPARMET